MTKKHNQKTCIFFTILLIAVFLFMTGCNNKKDAADVYIEMAQGYVNDGNYAMAVEILEKGISSVESEKIEKMLKEVIDLQIKDETALSTPDISDTPDTSNTQANDVKVDSIATDYSSYAGTWSEGEFGWIYGGFYMDVEGNNDKLSVTCCYVQSAPASRVAQFTVEFATENIKNNEIVCEYEDDGWGNCGKVKLVFDGDLINCFLYDIKSTDNVTVWGFYEGTYSLLRDNYVHEALDYTIDDYYELFPEENPDNYANTYEEVTPAPSDYIELAGIRYDNIMLPISTEQIMQDLTENKINSFKSGKQSIDYKIESILPLRGYYQHLSYGDFYNIYFVGYFSNGDVLQEERFYMEYKYYDIGGWVFNSWRRTKSATHSLSDNITMYGFEGKKNPTISYDDFQNGSPLSAAEIADDILYSGLNIIQADGIWQVFDIESVQVKQGNYPNGEQGDYLDLTVKVKFTNENYDVNIEYLLDYEFYVAGGWELKRDYIDKEHLYSDHLINRSTKFTPKTITYDDSNFLNTAKEYFDVCEAVEIKDSVDYDNQPVRTTTYHAERISLNVTEHYELVGTATFNRGSWSEDFNVTLKKADYSKLIGTWECVLENEVIRLTISDMGVVDGVAGIVWYSYETSPWTGAETYTDQQIISFGQNACDLNIKVGYLNYKKRYWKFYHHDSNIASLELKLGKAENTARVGIYKGSIHIDRLGDKYIDNMIDDKYFFTKVS